MQSLHHAFKRVMCISPRLLGALIAVFLVLSSTSPSRAQSWSLIAPAGPLPVPRDISAAVYSSASNRLILFGGYPHVTPYTNDLWILSDANGLGTPTWTQVIPNGAPGSPQARAGAVMVYDAQNNRAILAGGESAFPALANLNDVWVLINADGTTGNPTWTRLNPQGGFPGREDAGAVYDAQSNRLIVFMGVHPGGLCRPTPCIVDPADVWVLTNANGLGGTPVWNQLSASGAPPGRSYGSVDQTYDPVNNRVMVFGGLRPAQPQILNDVWVLTNANGLGNTPPTWTQLSPSGSLPAARSGNTAFYDVQTNRLVIFGGSNEGVGGPLTNFSDIWALDNANGLGGAPAWNQLNPNGLAITPHVGSSGLYDSARNRMILFGGGVNGFVANETWVLSDANGIPASQLKIDAVQPSRGGQGTVTAQIVGGGFQPGATVKLTGFGSDIVGANSTAPNLSMITTTFDLTGKTPGPRDVVVTNPDSTSATLASSFTVDQGGAPDIHVRKIGSPAVPGRKMTYFITLENLGNVDSDPVSVSEYIEPWFTFLNANPRPTNITQSGDTFPASALGTQYDSFLEWAIPSIPAEASATLSYIVLLDGSCGIGQTVNGRVCFANVGPDTARCRNLMFSCMLSAPSACSLYVLDPPAFQACILRQVLNCEAGWTACFATALFHSCDTNQQSTRGSSDPNDLIGPGGIGNQRWIAVEGSLQYLILFENLPAATKPAATVAVSDLFDPNTFDLRTLNIGPISFSSTVYRPPPVPLATTGFSADVDLRPSQNLIVRLNASLNVSTGMLTVNFLSIDPATGLPPMDVLAGFLPPGVGGNIVVKVSPKTPLTTGAMIVDQASIVFDTNASIPTPQWSNMFDNTPPTSAVASLSATEPTTSFALNWSGTDVGSGIQDFTIYVSDNGGPFTVFQTNTTATSATFTGQAGHSYSFYSIARDLVGNVEGAKTNSEAMTQVVTDTTPPITTAVGSPAPNAAGWNKSNVTVTLNSTDSEPGGTGVNQIQWSLTGAQTGSSTVPGSTTTVTISNEGTTILTYFGTDNAGNQEKPHSLTVQIDKTPPVITGSANPSVLWPPNGKMVNVTVSGTIMDATSGVNPNSATLGVVDTYGIVQPSGKVAVSGNGSYSFTLALEARRSGNDQNGRTFTITVIAQDNAGNQSSASTAVVVPHDQEN